MDGAMNDIRYEQDFYGWTQEQARLLREGRFAELDVANVVEEIESLGRGERRELMSRLRVLLSHLLKWQFQSGSRGRSWQATIETQREAADILLAENPSLKPQLDDIMVDAYRRASRDAVRETQYPADMFPAACPWSCEQVMADDFWPGDD
jgi:hypothetical protein